MRTSPEYRAWSAMKNRCSSISNPQYKDYGGRGIKVCERWRASFLVFLTDMGSRPTLQHSLDRIDNEGDYTPENCRWATKSEQVSNRRIMRNNKSGYTGVSYDKNAKKRKWRACVGFSGKSISVAHANTPKEAAYIRDQVVMQLYANNIKLNFSY